MDPCCDRPSTIASWSAKPLRHCFSSVAGDHFHPLRGPITSRICNILFPEEGVVAHLQCQCRVIPPKPQLQYNSGCGPWVATYRNARLSSPTFDYHEPRSRWLERWPWSPSASVRQAPHQSMGCSQGDRMVVRSFKGNADDQSNVSSSLTF